MFARRRDAKVSAYPHRYSNVYRKRVAVVVETHGNVHRETEPHLREVSRVPVGRRVEPLVVFLLPVVLTLFARGDHLGARCQGEGSAKFSNLLSYTSERSIASGWRCQE